MDRKGAAFLLPLSCIGGACSVRHQAGTASFAACRMMCATSSGCESIGTWLAEILRAVALLRHPAVLIGMDHAILGPKQRPRGQGFPGWLPGFRLEDTRSGGHLRRSQSTRLLQIKVVGEVLGEEIGIDPGQPPRANEQMLEDVQKW